MTKMNRAFIAWVALAEGFLVTLAVPNGAGGTQATFAPAGTTTFLDKLVYASYEDRADGELTDDDASSAATSPSALIPTLKTAWLTLLLTVPVSPKTSPTPSPSPT